MAPVPTATLLSAFAILLSPIATVPSLAWALSPHFSVDACASVGIIPPANITVQIEIPIILTNTDVIVERFDIFFAVSATTT